MAEPLIQEFFKNLQTGAVPLGDRVYEIRNPDGSVGYLTQTAEEVFQESLRDAEMRQARANDFAEEQAERERSEAVLARVKAFIAAGPIGLPLDASLPPARAALVQHLAWIEQSRTNAAATERRRLEITDAASRHSVARGELEELEHAVALALVHWTKFGGDGAQPDLRTLEKQKLRAAIEATEPLAGLLEGVEVEARVATAAVEALQRITPIRRHEALREAEGPALVSDIRALVEALASAFARLSALSQATTLDWQQVHELQRLGVSRLEPLLPMRASGDLPALPDGPLDFVTQPDPDAFAEFQAALAAMEDDPLGTVPAASPPAIEPPPIATLLSSLRNRFRRI